MKRKPGKKKMAIPRRRWQINPVERVQSSVRSYSRPEAKQQQRESRDE